MQDVSAEIKMEEGMFNESTVHLLAADAPKQEQAGARTGLGRGGDAKNTTGCTGPDGRTHSPDVGSDQKSRASRCQCGAGYGRLVAEAAWGDGQCEITQEAGLWLMASWGGQRRARLGIDRGRRG